MHYMAPLSTYTIMHLINIVKTYVYACVTVADIIITISDCSGLIWSWGPAGAGGGVSSFCAETL